MTDSQAVGRAAPPPEAAALPVAYLLGDSISAGYAPGVIERLAGRAAVRLRPDNGRSSRNLLEHVPAWLGRERLAVVHFNCGLHDIKRADGVGEVDVPLEEYAANLRRLVALLRERAGAVVWARTTPVIDGQPKSTKTFKRFNRDVDAYNAAADAVMAELGVPINDLHGAVTRAGLARCLSEDGVHMTDAGYAVLAEQVASAILAQLP